MSGLFGVITTGGNCTEDLFYGIDYHTHLGERKAGLTVIGSKWYNETHSIENTQFKSRFYQIVRNISGSSGIGVISDFHSQPISRQTSFGRYALAMAGLIHNEESLKSTLFNEGKSMVLDSEGNINPLEIVAKLFHREREVVKGINAAWEVIEGSASFLVITEEGIYAARDCLGRSPLVLGYKDDRWAVASESFAFENLGYQIDSYLGPGEIVLLTKDGPVIKQKAGSNYQICAFLWIYLGFPAACYEGINVEIVRERCGRFLAKRDEVKSRADMVAGVPDSGVAHALGYSHESGVLYRRPLVKYTPGYGRSYIPPVQSIRDLIAKMKLLAIPEIIKGQILVICEDSIVRGTQLEQFTIAKVKKAGAREIHIRPACPPLMWPCKFIRATRKLDELAARKAIFEIENTYEPDSLEDYLNPHSSKFQQMVGNITKKLGVDSILYQTLDDMVMAIGLPKEKLCTYCWTGK